VKRYETTWAAPVENGVGRDQVERVCTRYGLISHHHEAQREGYERGTWSSLKAAQRANASTALCHCGASPAEGEGC